MRRVIQLWPFGNIHIIFYQKHHENNKKYIMKSEHEKKELSLNNIYAVAKKEEVIT